MKTPGSYRRFSPVQLPRFRQVATRCYTPDIFRSDLKQVMSRSRNRVQDNVTSVQFQIPNWYVDGSVTNPGGYTYSELGTGGASTAIAGVEYPDGVFTQGETIVVPSGSTGLATVNISIPEGKFFRPRIYLTNPAGIVFSYNTQDAPRGEACEFGASGITNKVMGGTVTQTSGANMFAPFGIIARTAKKAVLLAGDSIMSGYYGDTAYSSFANAGYIARSIGAGFAYSSIATGGDRVELFLAGNHTQRLAQKQYHDAVICGYQRNSLGVGRTATQIVADLISFWNLFDIPSLQVLPTPDTTDLTGTPFTTLAAQNVQPWEAQRLSLRANLILENIECRDYIDLSSALEVGGKWAVSPAPTTLDGVHPSYDGTLAVRASRVVESRLLPILR